MSFYIKIYFFKLTVLRSTDVNQNCKLLRSMLYTTEHVLTPMGKRYSGVGDLGVACTP